MWAQAVAKEPADDVLKQIVRVLNQIKDGDVLEAEVKAVIYSCVPLKILLLPHAEILRQRLSADARVELYFRRPSEANYLIRETAPIASGASQKRFKRFWQDAAKHVKYEGFLWHLAPDDVKYSVRQKLEQPPHVKQGTKPQIKAVKLAPTIDWEEQLKTKPTEEVLVYALKALNNVQSLKEFVERLPEELLKLPDAYRLRQALNKYKQISLYSKYIVEEGCLDFWTDELAQLLQNLDSATKERFWQKVVDDLPSKSKALHFAPESITRRVFKRGFERYFEVLENIEMPDLMSSVTFDAQSIYGSLTDDDTALAKAWTNSVHDQADPYELARMLSARSAEKVAARFYKQLGYEVEDIASTQLSGDQAVTDWYTHDLLLDGTIPVDVKNARPPVNKGTYVDHIVPKSKESYRNEDVLIAGVRSPYLKLEDIELLGKVSYYRNIDSIFLGENKRARLAELQKLFCGDYLSAILVDRDGGGTFIPPWAFEYTDKFYELNASNHEVAAKIRGMQSPDWKTLCDLNLNPISVYLAYELSLPETWRTCWSKRQNRLVMQFEHRVGFKRSFQTLFTLRVPDHSDELFGKS